MTPDENELLTRVGPGTPMGAVLRRYWLPACLSEELAEPDGDPVALRLLGEDLVAFRDTTGALGLVEARCPHRRASLFFGRNEECGLRCVYHGWKFDVHGACVDVPSEPPASRLAERISLRSYPVWEAGGIVWAYLGPPELRPALPDYEWLRVPPTHFRVSKVGEDCNYLQGIEGGIDTVHSSFLHNNDLANPRQLRTLDTHPQLEVDVTDYGFRYVSIRNVSDEQSYLRVYQFLMPNQQMRGWLVGWNGEEKELPSIDGHLWVPIDDEHTWVYNWKYASDERTPISDEIWEEEESAMGRGAGDYLPGTYWLRRNPGNNFLVDRAVQRTRTFTGITGINTQDFAIQTGMGAVVERGLEHLASTDRAIVAARRLLLEAAAEVAAGREPRGSRPEEYRHLRSADALVPRGAPWRDVMKEALLATW